MFRPLLVFFVLAAGAVRSAEPSSTGLTVSSPNEAVLDTRTGNVTVAGPVKVSDAGLLFVSDQLTYNSRNGVYNAVGNVVLTVSPSDLSVAGGRPPEFAEGFRLLADRLTYDQASQTFKAENIRVGSYPVFIEGFSAAGSRQQITIERARGNYGEPSKWQPTFFADKLIYEPGRQVRTEKALLGIGEVRPISLSGFEHDLTQPFPLTFTVNGGYRHELGVYAEADIHLPVRRGVRLGADIGAYTERGVMIGPSGRYSQPQHPEELNGYFRTGYINDHGERGFDVLGQPVPEDRAYIEWQHTQKFGDNLSLYAQLNWWKDSEVVRDFRPRSFYPVQAPDTFLEAVHARENYSLSLFSRFQPNSFQRVQERLPEVRFDLFPTALGLGVYQRLNASAAVLREDPPDSGPHLRSNRLDAYYTIFRPSHSGDWLTVTPVLGGRLTHYTNTEGVTRPGDFTRLLGEVGLDAELRTNGVFNYRNDLWKINGLRHLFTPKISYRYIPETDRGGGEIPKIDREVFTTYLPRLGLGDVRNVDDLHALNTLRLGFDNTLQTRDPVHGSRDLIEFNLMNDFRFKRQPGEKTASQVQGEISLMPARWLQLDAFGSVDPDHISLQEFNAGITVKNASAWSVRLANNYLRGNLEDYLVDGRIRINEAFEALARVHYDSRLNRFNEQIYGLVQNIANTWLISYNVSFYSGRRRESGVGFNVQIDTVRF